MREIKITKREMIASVVIVLVMIGIGFFISTSIHNSVSVSNEKYFKSLKVDNNPEMFSHAIDTNIGDMLSYGKFKANEPVSDSTIKGKYFSIKKIEEHYVKKTRTVTYTDSDGNVKTKTETYWEWDEWDREYFHTKTFSYLGKKFEREQMKIDNYEYKETVSKGAFTDVRWVLYVIPEEFNATLYSNVSSKTVKQNELYADQTIESVVEQKENGADGAVLIFWILWSVLIIVLVFIFVALENKFLNNN